MPLTERSIVRFGGSRAVILPADWFRTFEIKEGQRLKIAYDNIVLILPPKQTNVERALDELKEILKKRKKRNGN
jgi:antitoxin component of MazEF toxin-antitoxin module